MMSVSIIIPVFNQWEFTEPCLAAVFSTIPADATVIVFNNGSTDGTVAGLAEVGRVHKNLCIIHSETNLGFSPACNAGAAAATTDYLVFLNNDTIPQPGWLEPLIDRLRSHPHIGVTGSRLLYPDSREINHCGYVFNPRFGGYYPIYHRFPGDFYGATVERQYRALLGACIAVRKAEFDAVGGFAEYGLEDIDLCLKLGERGRASLYVPSSVVLHHGSTTLIRSPKDKIPMMSGQEFNERWQEVNRRAPDDFLYFMEDGRRPTPHCSRQEISRVLAGSYNATWEGMLLARRGERERALLSLNEALQIFESNIDALSEKLYILAELGRIPEALDVAKTIVQAAPLHREGLLDLAELLHVTGRREEAIETAERLLAERDCSSDLRARMAEVVALWR